MSDVKRKHAAIVFTDIVGYTALMGSDEERAFEVLAKNREIHSKLINQFNGTLIKEMGDGMLISFELASEAVRCAIEIQKACKPASPAGGSHDIPLKIGIHEGEMVFEGNDVLGDGVNIASRIQDKASAGFILISDSIYRDIKNKHDLKARFLAESHFKNVDDALKIYAVNYPGSPDTGSLSKDLSNEISSHKSIIRQPIFGISSLFILAVATAVFFLFYRGTTLPFMERDWIVISDFENVTGEEIFDHSLNTAFVLSINQSRYINVIGRQRMKEALQRMKVGNQTEIDEETAREIAIREGVKICLIPSISKVGSQYVLTSKILDSNSGDIVKSEVLYAESQNEILGKLDQLTKNARKNLGESRYDIYNQSKPLAKVTTSSLDALKEFSLGITDHTNLNFTQARTHYENAIKIDSNFVAAKASLGNLLYERFDKEEGLKWLEETMASIDQLTDREKYGILAFYAVNIENDLEKGIDYTKSRIELYPDDPVARNNLGWYYQKAGMYEKAVGEYKAAIHINPYLMIAYGGLNWLYNEYIGQMDSVLKWSRQMIEYSPENAWGYFYLGSAHVGLNKLEEAAKDYQKSVELNPRLMLSQYRLAHVYRILGQFAQSREIFKNILEINSEELPAHYGLGINYLYEGKSDLANECFQRFLESAESWEKDYPDSPSTYTSIGAGWTQLGEKEKGWEMGKKAIEIDSTFFFEFAVFLSIQDRKTEALDYFEKALEDGYRDIVWIKLNPDLDPIRREPRFIDLLDKHF